MPAMSSRGRNRRTVNEINMVPFIDVMLVLLIIFMVTAPMLTPAPSTSPAQASPRARRPRTLPMCCSTRTAASSSRTAATPRPSSLGDLKGLAQSWQQGQGEDSAIQIIADKGLPFDDVMKAHTTLSKAGVKRIAFGVVSSSSN
jgi:biopolymer transport protein TolR